MTVDNTNSSKPTEPRAKLAVDLSYDLYEKLHRYCTSRGKTKREVVEALIRKVLGDEE